MVGILANIESRVTAKHSRWLPCAVVFACLCIPVQSLGENRETDLDASSSDDRELEANEDPLSRKMQAVLSALDSASHVEIYGSVRIRNRRTDSDDVLEDFGSRVGIEGWYETAPRRWLFARYELGFNLLEELDVDSLPAQPDQELGKTVFTRLGHIGMQFGENVLALGKNWSTYYQVAAFTDRFDSVGGQASGAFNARTDGGASGTGRADDVLQGRLKLKVFGDPARQMPLEINLQVQARQDIPGVAGLKYEQAFGISSILGLTDDADVGIAFNRGEIDVARVPVENRNGLDGDMAAWLLGARWYNDDWYLGATWSKTSNLHTTDSLTYFDGEGLEFYGQYRVANDVWLLAGMNKLDPDSDQLQAGEYRLRYGVFGIRYLFDGFARMVYLESRISSSRNADGTDVNNQVIVGLRWGFKTDQN